MAVATPVLEKEKQQIEDEKHNALIKERYLRLLNPESKMDDLKEAEYVPEKSDTPVYEQSAPVYAQAAAPVYEQPAAQAYSQPAATVYEQTAVETHTYNAGPVLAPSGRADADIFRADSEINMRLKAQREVSAAPQPAPEEDENEDLRPTQTTIQYKTEAVRQNREEGAKVTTRPTRHLNLSKHDKIVIAAVVVVIVALFALIIVNSAIISGINNELSALKTTLNTARGAYSGVSDKISEYTLNLEDTVKALAERLGMVR